MGSKRIMMMLCLMTVMGGCASGLPLRQVSSDKNRMMLTDASSVLTVTRSRNPGIVTCSRMNSDVSVSRTASLSVSTLNLGDEGESSGEEETELQGRTPGLLAMRDALFHSCMLYQSGVITASDLQQMTQSILNRSFDVISIEANNSQWIFNEQASFSGPSGVAAPPVSTVSSADQTSSGDFADFN